MISINHKKEKPTVNNTLLIAVALGFCLLFSVIAPLTASADWGFNMGADGFNPKGRDNPFNKIEIFIPDLPENAGITFSGGGVSDFSNPQWNANKINPGYIVATGPTITGSLFWDVLFTGTQPLNFSFDYLVYDSRNNRVAYAVRMTIVNGVITSTYLDPKNLPNYDRTPAGVPIPPTVFLFGAGLIGMAVLRKRVHRKDNTS